MHKVHLYSILNSLSTAIDLAESTANLELNNTLFNNKALNNKHVYVNHSKRTCYIAMKLAENINKDPEFTKKVYESSILHDIGITASFSDSHFVKNAIFEHCKKGSELISRLPLEEGLSDILLYHHENYDGSEYFGLKGEEIPLISQIIRLADLFELNYSDSIPNYFQREHILNFIRSNKGTIFSPAIVDVFEDVQKYDAFWWDVENISYEADIIKKARPAVMTEITLDVVKDISLVFSDIIDRRSEFTYEHSRNLSKLIIDISNYMNYDKEKKTSFEIAALLHDIGKLSVPNSILDKNGKLDSIELTIMKGHTYYTRFILSKLEGFEEITNWAANHHEKLNGSGYPLGLKGDSLSFEERVMATCDIYEALASKRPYKKAMDKSQVFSILSNMAEDGQLCKNSIELLKKIV